MQFLRDAAKAAGQGFKGIADEVWGSLGNTENAPEGAKVAGRTMGKYALTAQLLMMLNFPDDAEMYRDTYNITGGGPTGARNFKGTVGNLLARTAQVASSINMEAMEVQGFADISSTSTYDDLSKLLPQLTQVVEKKPAKRGKNA